MKIYGYKKHVNNSDELILLSEISIQTSPEKLRSIANFILKTADEIEKINYKTTSKYHSHLRDNWTDWKEEYTDVIIVSE